MGEYHKVSWCLTRRNFIHVLFLPLHSVIFLKIKNKEKRKRKREEKGNEKKGEKATIKVLGTHMPPLIRLGT